MQKNMQVALEGNNELRQQLKEVQDKLDALLAKKKNRDRKDFDRKNEGRNPRPAPTSDRRQRNDCAELGESEEANSPMPELPTEIIEHAVPPEQRVCPDCNIETNLVGTSVVSQLESVLQTLRWVEHHQETRSCPKCKTYIVKAPKPTAPIPGSYAGPGLLSRIIVDKVDDALPNYRQQRRYARESLPIARSTQCDWSISTAQTLEPLYELIGRQVLSSEIVQSDESLIKFKIAN